jgi:hypothetical protein
MISFHRIGGKFEIFFMIIVNRKMYLMRFTAWDANVYLCLRNILPEDIVKRMIYMVKETHEKFSVEEARRYWENNSPTLVRMNIGGDIDVTGILRLKFFIPNDKDLGKSRISVCRARSRNMIEFKKEWIYRSIEERQKKVVDWCKFGSEQDQRRHRKRLRIINHSESYSNSYKRNLWATWDSWSHCEHPPRIHSWDTVRPEPRDRRVYISKWYEGIHPGRFFLFFQKNKIIEERYRGVPAGICEDGYQYPKIPIFDKGPYEQLIEDLRCLDGGGLGEKVGKKVEHIDDLFY